MLRTRGARCSRTGSRPELRRVEAPTGVDGISNTVRPGSFRPLDQTRTVEIGRVSPRRKLEDSGPRGSWMACRHGASPPCRRPEVQASAVEHARGVAGRGRGELRFAAASFENSARTPSRALVRAGVHGADRRLDLELLRVALGLVFNLWLMQAEA